MTDVGDLPIGSRVVVRRRLGPGEVTGADGPTMTDAVGELVARDAATLTMRTARGEITIERPLVVAAKVVPPKPTRRGPAHLTISTAALQRVMSPSWGALERDRLGDWELRASGGFTQRGNSVVPVGSPGVSLAEGVTRVERWYADRGLPAVFALPGSVDFDPEADPLGAELVGRGYGITSRTLILTARSSTVVSADPGGPGVSLSTDAGPEWLAAYLTTRPCVPGISERVVTGGDRQLFGQVLPRGGAVQTLAPHVPARPGTAPIALGRLGIAHGWAGLGAVWTDPAYRGRGLAGHLTARLAARALEGGVHLIHLQVDGDNPTAIGLYRRLGFAAHSAAAYLTQPTPAGSRTDVRSWCR